MELLPKHEKDEDPRRELTGQLLEYQAPSGRGTPGCPEPDGQCVYPTAMPLDVDLTYRLSHSPALLLAAYRSALGKGERLKPPPGEVFRPLVAARFVSVGSRIVSILAPGSIIPSRVSFGRALFPQPGTRERSPPFGPAGHVKSDGCA